MERRYRLFFDILSELDKEGVLRNLILIGGWCQNVYKEHFGNPLEISTLRTADVDFLISNPPKIEKKTNLPEVFKRIGFDEEFSTLNGYAKYVHPELEIEFLTPELGKGRDKPYEIKKLNVQAQGLRYLNLLQEYTMEITFHGINIVVPEPPAFVLHKLMISERRKSRGKEENDIRVAKQIGEYLLENARQKQRMRLIYQDLPTRWKRRIIAIARQHSEGMYNLLR